MCTHSAAAVASNRLAGWVRACYTQPNPAAWSPLRQRPGSPCSEARGIGRGDGDGWWREGRIERGGWGGRTMPARRRAASRQAQAQGQGQVGHGAGARRPHRHGGVSEDGPLPLSPVAAALAMVQRARWQARIDAERLGVGLAVDYEPDGERLAALAGGGSAE